MKIATNVDRDAFGGITISNLALFDWLEGQQDTIVGVEYVTGRHVMGPTVFRRYDPSFFQHHIVNSIDLIPRLPWDKAWGMGHVRRRWHVLVETTKDILRKEAPDIVLVNGTYFAPWILATAAREVGIPTVVRYAGVLKREVAHKGFVARRHLLTYERWIAASAEAVIFPSTLCRRVVEEEVLGHPVAHGTVIPNPVDITLFRTRKHLSRPIIAAVGRWTPVKNFTAFMRLHEQLLNEHWPHRAVLVTQAKGNLDLPQSLERRDPMSREELRAFYRSIELLIVPSKFETFCNVAAEAVMSGTPVLVSEQVGFAEILRKAKMRHMVISTFDDPVVVAQAVKRLAKIRVTTTERKAVAALLDPHRVHGRILRVLRDVLER